MSQPERSLLLEAIVSFEIGLRNKSNEDVERYYGEYMAIGAMTFELADGQGQVDVIVFADRDGKIFGTGGSISVQRFEKYNPNLYLFDKPYSIQHLLAA